MKNPHIIVAHPSVCLCGNYDGEPVGCKEFIESFQRIIDNSYATHDATETAKRMLSLVKDMGEG